MKRKVLYLGGFEMPDKNAAAQRVLANAMTLRDLGYDVSFIGPTKDPTNCDRVFNGFKCEYIDYPKTLCQWLRFITIFISIDKILEFSPNYVILYNFPAIASLRILRASHKKGVKVVHDLTEWESADGWTPREIIRKIDINLRMRFCMKRMDGVIAISRYLYDYYSRYTKTILVPPTVDLTNSKFCRGRKLTSNNPIQLVYAGSIGVGNKERLDYIINTVSKEQSLKLTVVGLTVEQYESVYGNLPNECTNVIFKGRVPHNEAVNIVVQSDFQMLIRENSLKNKAGFPTKFVESVSCCTPLIATISSNICDYLVEGENGFIVDDYKSLSAVLVKISLMNSNEIVRMKEKCRAFLGFDYRFYKEEFSRLFV
jgi:glycosyltransferase involved in cell wall biosynthesis